MKYFVDREAILDLIRQVEHGRGKSLSDEEKESIFEDFVELKRMEVGDAAD